VYPTLDIHDSQKEPEIINSESSGMRILCLDFLWRNKPNKQTNKTIARPQMLRNEIAKENQNSSKINTGKDETDRK
jgi:hypothetical protein